ncbi:MAG TPA: ammonia channel protein, partial [Hyphomicrobiaceae bacterium]|nr:ammonia channel protein [Hyphomicrobiaceae bacterium]
AKLAEAKANQGMIYNWGAIDFAGGTVVHINAGIAGLVGALIIGRRVGFGREVMAPHSLTMTMIGGAMLWVGWIGFNAGSALEATGGTALALLNTMVATAAAALAWILVENLGKGHPSMLGAVSGAVAGLVAITPAAGVAGPMGSIVLGFVAGIVCYVFCTTIKNTFRYDDALDVFGVHCIGGIVGAIGTAIVAAPMLGGTGVMDYETGKIGEYVIMAQLWIQAKAVAVTLVWSGVISALIFLVISAIVGLRPSTDQEREGLDLVDHGERAYNY